MTPRCLHSQTASIYGQTVAVQLIYKPSVQQRIYKPSRWTDNTPRGSFTIRVTSDDRHLLHEAHIPITNGRSFEAACRTFAELATRFIGAPAADRQEVAKPTSIDLLDEDLNYID
jgi:hypothetical protein